MTDSATELPEPRARRSGMLALVLVLLWLVAATSIGVFAARAGFRIAPDDLTGMAMLAAGLAAPVAALVLLAMLATRSSGNAALLDAQVGRATTATAAIGRDLREIDALLAAVAARLEAVRTTVADDGDGIARHATNLADAGTALLVASQAARDSGAGLHAALPEAQAQVAAIATLLASSSTESARQIGEIETQLAAVWARHDDAAGHAEAIAQRLTDVLQRLETSSAQTTTAIGERVGLLDTSVEAVYDRTTAALDATRDGVHAQTSALLAAVDQARVALDHIGGEAARAIGKRLEKLLGAADHFGAVLGAQDERSRGLVDTIERSFVMLDGKLGHSSTMGSTTLDHLGARVAQFRADVEAMGPTIQSTEGAMLDIEAVLTRLRDTAADAMATLATRLPATGDSIDGLATDVAALQARIEALADPVARGQGVIDSAAAAFATQQHALDTGAAQFAARLEAARATLDAVETQTQGSALASANALIEVLARVREVANASTGAMRATIEGIVAEAEQALESAGAATAESAFGTPVRTQLAAIGTASSAAADAAQAAIERVSQRLLGLTTVVASVEARIDEADFKFDQRSRSDMATRAALIIDQLNAASIDITKRLSLDVGDGAWAEYLKGDRSIFARRAVQLLDRGSARAIARHFTHDADFRDLATGYVATFEALLERASADREGKTLAVTLVSSDVGKLYVALNQAVDRGR